MKPASDTVAQFFAEYPDSVGDLAHQLRSFLRQMLPEAREELDRRAHVVGYSFGSGYAGLVCTIIMSQTGAELGIFGSADLPDPSHLLEGRGKRHRYISFKKASDFERPGIRNLIVAALARWQTGRRARPDHALPPAAGRFDK